uniref:Uncharacterized protein n=1 Tax=Corethron hystrix TaxID=216773 RepID=A0A7S1BMM6_9STRA|mmetsp:Transcript_34146/g.78838  ORF Transcript_34146/g.78838 Transcript_34146/m.78838 type:complete len:161 (+) Transcript_34146:206-688(+)
MCALACLAVLDRQNAPLYVRGDFSSFFGSSPSFDGEEPDGSVSDSRGIGGAASAEAGGGPTPPAVNFASLRHQFMIHAALDHIDEKVRDIISLGGQTNNNDMMYLGFLCPVEEMRLYEVLRLLNRIHMRSVVLSQTHVRTRHLPGTPPHDGSRIHDQHGY